MIQITTVALFVFAVVSASAFTPVQIQFQEQILKRHNELRAQNCAPDLQLDDQLSATAQAYAEYLVKNNKIERSNNGYGENIYTSSSSEPLTELGSKAADSWYDEMKDYNFNRPSLSSESEHFTQLVWKSSKKFGAGVAFSPEENKAIVVANYYPPGNQEGQFSRYVLSTDCRN